MFYLYGYTLNRITLFALIFSIGILVDDAIVVVENIVRHARLSDEPGSASLLDVVDPGRRRGRQPDDPRDAHRRRRHPADGVRRRPDGPYMRPIPVGASAAMIFSLIVAFVVTPWAALRLLKPTEGHEHDHEDRLTLLYRRVMGPLIDKPKVRLSLPGRRRAPAAGRRGVRAAEVGHGEDAAVRQQERVPGDRSTCPRARRSSRRSASRPRWPTATLEEPAVVNVQSYVGTSSPYNFNGLVRHYFLRRVPHLADLQVNLAAKDERSEQSHDIAKRVADALLPLAAQVRRHDAGGRGAARAAGAADARGRGLRSGRERRRDRGREPGEGHLRADARRRRRRLVRRGARSAGVDLVVDEEKAAAAGLSAAAVVVGGRGWRRRRRRRACCTTGTRARTCRSSSGCPRARLSGLADTREPAARRRTRPVAVGELTRPVSSAPRTRASTTRTCCR